MDSITQTETKGDVEFRRFVFHLFVVNEVTCHVKPRDFRTLVYKLLLSFGLFLPRS